MIEALQTQSSTKAAKQFDTLASALYTGAVTLLTLKESDTEKKPIRRTLDGADLRLRSIAYRIRAVKTLGSISSDQLLEFWTLVAHSMVGLRAQLPPTSPKENFGVLRMGIEPILDDLLAEGISGVETKFITCSNTFASFAEDAQNWKDALEILNNVDQRLNPKQNQSLVYSVRIRIATSVLKGQAAGYFSKEGATYINNALECITQPLSGNKERLVTLFYDVMQLRRAASGYLNTLKAEQDDALRLGADICFAAVSFCRRISTAGILDLSPTSKERAMIVGSVDHFLVASRKSPIGDDVKAWWEREDQRLQEILALALHIEDQDDEETGASKQSMFEKISVFYQQHSLVLRKEGNAELSIKAMKRSIACLENRSSEDSATGGLANKHEKLAQVYLASKDYTKALGSLSAALDIYTSSGVFDNLSPAFADGITEDDTKEKFAAKCLSNYVKCCLESKKATLWDSDDLPEDTKAAIMLFQINACLAHGSSKGFELSMAALTSIISNDSGHSLAIRSR